MSPLRLPHEKRWRIFVVPTLLLLALAVTFASAASSVEADDRDAFEQPAVRQRQQRFVDYAKRVSAAMSTLLSVKDDDEVDFLGNDNSKAQHDAEAAGHQQKRAHLGLNAEVAHSGPLYWASTVKDTFARANANVNEAMAAVVRLAQVSVGASSHDQNEAHTDTQEKLKATRQQRLRARGIQETPEQFTRQTAASVEAESSSVDRKDVQTRTTAPTMSMRLTLQQKDLTYTCDGGAQAFTTDSVWQCANGTQLDAKSCLMHAQDCAQSCSLTSGTTTCVCPLDAVLYRTSDNIFCLSRALNLRPELPKSHLCQDELGSSLGLARTSDGEYCFSTRRKDRFSFKVTYHFSLLSDADIMAINKAGDTIVYPSFSKNSTKWILSVDNERVLTGTYDELSMNTRLFKYVTPPKDLTNFAITTKHQAVRSAAVFAAVYSFSAPEVMLPLMQEHKLSNRSVAAAYIGARDGVAVHNVTYDLSAVPDECVEGNQLYMEVGVGGNGVYLTYRVARIHVAFTDLPEPPVRYKYPKQFNVLYIFLIALIAAIVIGCALAIVWYCCQKQEEPEDDLVAKAQRNRTRKEEIEKGRDEKKKRQRGVGGGREADALKNR